MLVRRSWVSALALACLLAAVQACGSDDSGSSTPAGGNKTCSPMGTTGNCSQLDTCCDSNGTTCWYEATKSGSSQTFNCAGTDCQSAAQEAVNFCMN